MKKPSSTKVSPAPSSPRQASRSDLLAWLSESSPGGVAVFQNGHWVFENTRFGHMLVDSRPEDIRGKNQAHAALLPLATREQIQTDALRLSQAPGARTSRRYGSLSSSGKRLTYEAEFTVVPFDQHQAVLVVLEDATKKEQLAADAASAEKFQSVLARIGALAVSGVGVQDIMNEAVRLTVDALNVDLCKILIPRESDEHLYLMAGVGWRQDLLGSLTVEGGTHSQAGFAIRERRPVVVRDMREETRFTPSKLLTEHGGISGMSVPMMVEDRVYGVMGAHCKRPREFSDKELEFLCSVGNTIATVLQRWRRQETQLQLYHRLFELVQDGIMLTDTQGRLLEWNPAMEKMTGWKREEVIGRTPAILQSGKQGPDFDQRLGDAIRNGHAFVDRFVNRRKDGSEFLVWESISPVKDPEGTIRYFLAILTDLTERERMLEALRHAEQVKLVGQLAGGILHEIRNPLIGIGSLATHLAGQASLPPATQDRCRLIAEEATRIDQILESHLGQLPPRQFEFRPCDLPALLEDTLALLRTKLQANRINLAVEVSPGLPAVQASRGHLQQVWLNLFLNAIEAMPQGGTLTVTIAPRGLSTEGVSTTIQDTGVGISPDNLARIFEPFFTSGKAKGVGLGLTLSRDIIERHGGQLVINSPAGSGAIVDIWLPLQQGTTDGMDHTAG